MADEKRPIIRPMMNVPYELRLRFATPREIEGRYGAQMMFTVQHEGTEKLVFFDPKTAQRIQDLGLREGEPFVITKQEVNKGRAKGIQWLIERLAEANEEARQPGGSPTAAETTTHARQAHGQVDPQANRNTHSGSPNGAPQATQGGPRLVTLPPSAEGPHTGRQGAETGASRVMGGCLVAAIDALLMASAYGAERGLKLSFNEEDVRATAASLFIQHHKDGSFGRDFARQAAGGAQ